MTQNENRDDLYEYGRRGFVGWVFYVVIQYFNLRSVSRRSAHLSKALPKKFQCLYADVFTLCDAGTNGARNFEKGKTVRQRIASMPSLRGPMRSSPFRATLLC